MSLSGTVSSTTSTIPAITGQIDYSRAIHVFPDVLQPWRSTVLAYSASLISTTMGFPLDTVKTRMQTHKNFTSYFDCIKKTYVKEGAIGFFRGIWAPLLSTSFSKSLSVLIFTDVKPSVYKVLYGDGPTSGTSLSSHPLLLNAPVCMVSGFIAGGGVSVFACPFEFTKVYSQILVLVHNKLMKDLPRQLQTNHQSHHGKSPSTAAIFRQIVRHEGIKGLYSGYKYHFLRDSISSGVYYSIYESLKWTMNSILDKYQVGSPQISILLAGGFLGILGWTVVFPYDTTKSLIQKDIVTNILRKEQGLEPLPLKERKLQKLTKNLYRGLGISITRTFIVNMAFFSFYEFTMAHIA